MITVLRALVDKADTAGTAGQREQERGILRKDEEECWRPKHCPRNSRLTLMGFLVNRMMLMGKKSHWEIYSELTALLPLRYTPQHIPTVHPSSQGTGGQLRTRPGSTCPAQGADSTALGASPAGEPALPFPALRLNTRVHSPACTWLHALCRECQSGWLQL